MKNGQTRQPCSRANHVCFGGHHKVSALVGGGSQMNKFEQVSSVDHQMSVAGKGRQVPRSDVKGKDVPYISHVMYLTTHGQSDACENITFPQ